MQLDELYGKEIKGLADGIRRKMHSAFFNRWVAFHAPVMSAAFCLHPEFCSREFDQEKIDDAEQVMEELAKVLGCPYTAADVQDQWQEFKNALQSGQVNAHVVTLHLQLTQMNMFRS